MGIPKETHLNCKFRRGTHFSYAARVKFQTTVYLMCNVFFLHFYIFISTYWGVYVFIYMKCAALTHCHKWTRFRLMFFRK